MANVKKFLEAGAVFAYDLADPELYKWFDITGAPRVVAGPTGLPFNALSFDNGNPDYLLKNFQPVTSYPFSLVIWFRGGAANGTVFDLADSSIFNTNYFLDINNGNIRARRRNAGTLYTATSTLDTSSDTDYHCGVGVYESNTSMTVYVDGGNSATDTNSVTFSTEVDRVGVAVNADSTPAGSSTCRLALPLIFPWALSPDEVSDLHNNTVFS